MTAFSLATIGRRVAVTTAAVAAVAATVLVAPLATPQATAATTPPKCPTAKTTVLRTTPATYYKTVALTFDDGPSKHTPQILAVLKAKRVHATFFMTGKAAAASPAGVRAEVAAGHKLGNHTYSHPQNIAGSSPRASFDTLSARTQASQMDATTTAIAKTGANARACFFRAPGGHHFASTTVKLSRARGMSVAHWSADTMDWAQPRYASPYYQGKIVKNATTSAAWTRHPIILMHDGKASPEPEWKVSSYRGNRVAALGRVIDWYKARGYVFVDPAGHRI